MRFGLPYEPQTCMIVCDVFGPDCTRKCGWLGLLRSVYNASCFVDLSTVAA